MEIKMDTYKKAKTLRYEKETVNFANLTDAETIERLEIVFCNLENLSGITCLSRLRQIHIYYCRNLKDISSIGDLNMLEEIDLFSLPKVETHFSVAKLHNLNNLAYTTVGGINSICGIEELPELKRLALSKVKVIDEDYSPIVKSKSLKRVFWFGSPFKSPALKELRKLRPDIITGGNAYNEEYWKSIENK